MPATNPFSTISFIADLGGALSLFVGVSFLSVWDCGEYIVEKYKSKTTIENEEKENEDHIWY